MAERKIKVAETAEATEEAAVKSPTAAAPLAAPQPKPVPEVQPPAIMLANAVAPSVPHNETGTRLLDEKGDEISWTDALEYPGPDDPGVLVTVTQRIYREFTHLGATTKTTQLLYPAGARVTKAEANRLKAEIVPPPAPAGG